MAHRNLPPEDLPEKLRDFLLEEDSLAVRELTRNKSMTGSFMQGGGAGEPSYNSRYRGGEELGGFRLLLLIGKGEGWEAEVASVPGSAFGTEGHVRLSYALAEEQITEALERLGRFLAQG